MVKGLLSSSRVNWSNKDANVVCGVDIVILELCRFFVLMSIEHMKKNWFL